MAMGRHKKIKADESQRDIVFETVEEALATRKINNPRKEIARKKLLKKHS